MTSVTSDVYVIDKRFHTEVERTPRVLEIAEAFGLGLDDKEFVVFDNQKLEIHQGDVVYVTGQSGSGKSTVLRELASQMTAVGLKVANIDGEIREAIAFIENPPAGDTLAEDTFVEVEPFTVQYTDVDDSREASYRRSEAE